MKKLTLKWTYYIENIMVFHGPLHGIDEVLLSFNIQCSDIIPGGIQLFNVFFYFRLIGLSTQLDELLTHLATMLHFRLGLLDIGPDML